jgi:hypothetical protein
MKPSDLKTLIASRFKAGIKRPILVESSPGLGKTQIAAQAAKELNIGFKAMHAPLLQPEDYGFPIVSQDKTDVNFVVSKAKFPLEGSDCAESGILLIDELSQADNSAQKILRNLIQEREIHGQRLKSGWAIIATGNRTTDRAGANRLLSHLSNVLTRITLDVSLDDWTQWAIANYVKPEVIAFIRFRPELLTNFDPQNEVNATPRAWSEGVSASLGVIDSSLEFPVFSGDVGEGPASEFLGFLKIFRKLPSPDAILINPDSVDVPTDPATLYAICGAMAFRTTTNNFSAILKYIMRLPSEFSVLYIRDAIARYPKISETKDFIAWASGPGSKLLA